MSTSTEQQIIDTLAAAGVSSVDLERAAVRMKRAEWGTRDERAQAACHALRRLEADVRDDVKAAELLDDRRAQLPALRRRLHGVIRLRAQFSPRPSTGAGGAT